MNKPEAALPRSLGEALAQARGRIDTVDARILLREASGATAAQLVAFPERPLSPEAAHRYLEWLAQRADGKPVAHILGRREFYGRPFRVSPATLIPRPDTELLVELALHQLQGIEHPHILDLGTGSGAIAVSLALECPGAEVDAVDFSPAALEVAQNNAMALGARVRFHAGSERSVGQQAFPVINDLFGGASDLINYLASIQASISDSSQATVLAPMRLALGKVGSKYLQL